MSRSNKRRDAPAAEPTPIPEQWLRRTEDQGTLSPRHLKQAKDLLRQMRADWGWRGARLKASGDPTMTAQNFAELLSPVMLADQTAVAGTSDAILWSSQFSALPANFFDRPGKTVIWTAMGVMTTAATPGTLILNPRYGTTTAGTSLGVSSTSGTLAVSQTAVPWFMQLMTVCRSIGTAGTLVTTGHWHSAQGYAAAPAVLNPGTGAVISVDTTVSTGGLVVSATHSVAGSSSTTRALSLVSYN